jgi:hypothetical protein
MWRNGSPRSTEETDPKMRARGKMTDHENENEAQATIEMTIGNNQIDFQLQ